MLTQFRCDANFRRRFGKLPRRAVHLEFLAVLWIVDFRDVAVGEHVGSAARDYAGTQRRLQGNYTKSFPSVHFTHDITPNLKARLSWSTSFGRPNMTNMFPSETPNEAGRFVTVSNPGLLQMIKGGKAHALVVPSDTRYAVLPDTPTMVEAGLPRFPLQSWMGLFAPAGTPLAMRAKVAGEIAAIMKDPAFREKNMLALGMEPIGNSPEEFAKFIANDRRQGEELIRIAGPRQF